MTIHRKQLFIAGGVALVLAAGAGLVGRASAHGPFGGGRGGFGRTFLEPGGLKGAHDQALADALGISADKLTTAQEKVAAERLAQAVKNGTLTQEQADLMTASRKLARSIDRQAIAAQVLGMSKADLEQALKDGKTLKDLAEAADLDESALREKMQAAIEAATADAVKAGTITQAQADALAAAGGRMGWRGHFGHGRGFGPGRGPGRGVGPAPDEGAAPEGGPNDARFSPGGGFMGGDL